MKVIVYLPAAAQRKLTEAGADPAEWVRQIIRDEVAHLPETDEVAVMKSTVEIVHSGGPVEVVTGDEVVMGRPPLEIACTAPVGTKCKIHGKVCNPRGNA